MKWLLLVLLLGSCLPIPSSDSYGIVIYANNIVIPHGGHIICGGGETKCLVLIRFSFTEKKISGRAVPVVYINGDGYFSLNDNRHNRQIHNIYNLQPNMTYEGIAQMRKKGRMTILFSWETGNKFHKSQIIHVDNY